jgi:hypothetical protein
MNEVELKSASAVRTALLNQLNACGMHALPNTESAILAWFTDKGVTTTAPNGYLVLTQTDGSAAVPSSACETLRKERPELFAADAARDKVSSRQDLERGSQSEISKAKAQYIGQHGLAAYEALPKTHREAELKAAPVSLDMTRSQYLALSFSERSRLAGAIGAEGIGRIMGRRG